LREREPLNYDRMRNLRSHLPTREPRANCRSKTKPSSGHDHAAGIRNSFDFAASLVGGGRTVHPVSRVFRRAFHGLRVTGRLASSTRFRIPRGDEPGGALRLILFVYQCLKRNAFTIASSAALTCLGLPSSIANTY